MFQQIGRWWWDNLMYVLGYKDEPVMSEGFSWLLILIVAVIIIGLYFMWRG